MISSDFRKEAREKLESKWGKAALITLVYAVLFIVFNYIDRHTTGLLNLIVTIAMYAVEIPLAYGLVIAFMKLFNGEEVGTFDFFTLGFDNFSRAWSIVWHMLLKVIVPFILVMVSYFLMGFGAAGATTSAVLGSSDSTTGGLLAVAIVGLILAIVSYIWLIVKMYYYQLSQFIAIDNPDMSGKDTVLESRKLMEGKRWKLFCLQFSFIGWAILAALTFGIGLLWLVPYIQFAGISFYKHILGNTEAVVQTPTDEVKE